MNITVSIQSSIGRELAAKIAACNRTAPVLDAMGTELVGIAKRSFNDSGLRVAPWPPKKKPNGQPLLKLTGNLWHSLRVVAADARSVSVGSDRPYAAIHQLGGTIRRRSRKRSWTIEMPARPFFPFDSNGNLAPFAARKLESVARAKFEALFRR